MLNGELPSVSAPMVSGMDTSAPLPEVMGEELAILIFICPKLTLLTMEKSVVSEVTLAAPAVTLEASYEMVKSPETGR